MKFIIQTYSTVGLRVKNEDTMEIINNFDGSNKDFINSLYVSIFDGHGGSNISKYLIENINIKKYFCNKISNIATNLSSSTNYNKKYIIPLFLKIQEKLKNITTSSNNMGSTALISIFYYKKNKLYLKVINLGDSRAILCNNYNIALQLSLDHKPHLYCEINRIKELNGEISYSENDDPRINGMSVSRSFGDLDNKYISQEPDVYDYKIFNEKFMIMACDGLWDVISNQEAVDFILNEYNLLKKVIDIKNKSDKNLANKLADYALKKGSKDNISICIIFFY